MNTYQFTLFDSKKRYKPMACLVKAESRLDFASKTSKGYLRGIENIRAQHGWSEKELRKIFDVYKVRPYRGGQ